MRRYILLLTLAALLVVVAACGKVSIPMYNVHGTDFQWHKHTMWAKLHWNYLRPDNETIVADGMIETFNPTVGLHTVTLELVGLDDDGNVINSASGAPSIQYIASPEDKAAFKIAMKLNGREKSFTMRGRYYHYVLGVPPDWSSANFDTIPVSSDEEL